MHFSVAEYSQRKRHSDPRMPIKRIRRRVHVTWGLTGDAWNEPVIRCGYDRTAAAGRVR
jgi:hypothetical protein